jgi:lysine-specific histone demethylase 1B
MRRRTFMHHSGMTLLAGTWLPGALMACTRRDSPTYPGEVLIIGAGAAGLFAGYTLHQRGVKFHILEAAPVHGGRLGKITHFADFPLDSGAQWLHGLNSLIGKWVRKTNTPVTAHADDISFWHEGVWKKQLPQNVDIFEGRNLPDVSYLAYAAQRGLDTSYTHVVQALAAEYGADAADLSVYYTQVDEEQWTADETDYKFRDTYFDLIDRYVAAPVASHITTGVQVVHISHGEGGITATDAEGRSYSADKAIITVPITVLRSGSVVFDPPLPASKTAAWQRIGMGPGMKVFLRFSEPFYHPMALGGATCAVYIDEKVGKQGHHHVLLAFVMGGQAAALSALGSGDAIAAALLAELDAMYGGAATPRFLGAHVCDWSREPHIGGAYSYARVGMGKARVEAAAPIGRHLYFAGEATHHRGHPATVHGAAETGVNAAMAAIKHG